MYKLNELEYETEEEVRADACSYAIATGNAAVVWKGDNLYSVAHRTRTGGAIYLRCGHVEEK